MAVGEINCSLEISHRNIDFFSFPGKIILARRTREVSTLPRVHGQFVLEAFLWDPHDGDEFFFILKKLRSHGEGGGQHSVNML